MKAMVCVAAAVVQVMFAGGVGEDSLTKALTRGADVDIGIRVIDDEGAPVADAECCGWIYLERDAKRGCRYSATTDTNGLVRIVGRSSEWVSVNVSKEGYYGSQEKIVYPAACDSPVVDGKWQPYGETRTIVLKRVRNPIQIGELYRCSVPIPAYDKWVGFDVEQRKWTPPYGDGKHGDVLLKFGRELVHNQFDYKMTMEVSFTNNPYAGFYQMKEDAFSELKTTYKADPCADFCASNRYVQERHPDSSRNDNRLGDDSYLIFRTRTKTDEAGKLMSAHYGIIRGRWSFFSSMLTGGYLFNPTPNDTNLEDAETYRMSLVRRKQKLEFERRRKAKEK